MGVKRDGKGRVACFWRKGGYQEGEGMKKERGADTPLRTMTWRYYPFIHVYHKSRSYDIWFPRYKEQRPVFCHFGPFLPFDPPNNPKNQDFEKIKKKTPGDIIILHLHTRNNDHMTYGSWYIEHERQNFLSFWAICCPPNNLENQNFEKMKKTHGGIIILNMSNICMIPEICSMTDRIYSHFGPFFAFLHPLPPNNPENQNFEIMKKTPGDIILHKCTTNDNHMIYGSWDMKCTRQNFFVISGHFLPFYPHNSPKKWKFQKMKKEPGDIIILHNCTKNHDHMLYCSWQCRVTDVIVIFHFGLCFTLYPHSSPKNEKFKKMKKTLEIKRSKLATAVSKCRGFCRGISPFYSICLGNKNAEAVKFLEIVKK